MIGYACEQCLGEFRAEPRRGATRCALCGSLSVKPVESSTHRVRDELTTDGRRRRVFEPRLPDTIVGGYACAACAREFEHVSPADGRVRVVHCTQCGSDDVVSISPKARALMSRSVPLTSTEIKRAQFVRRGWALRCEADRWCRTFLNLAHRSGLTPERAAAYEKVLGDFMGEIDAAQEQRLREYERMRA